jgi:hypothetical protein
MRDCGILLLQGVFSYVVCYSYFLHTRNNGDAVSVTESYIRLNVVLDYKENAALTTSAYL